jgi:flagellin-like hook-associated protein FlgL
MAGIFPVPTGRVSDLLYQQRLLAQLQSDQRNLLRFQDQVSTGRRFTTPSENAPAAVRGISLQRLLEQKEQIKVNLTTSQSYLSATDTAIAGVAQQLTHVRALSVKAADSTTSETERKAISLEIDAAVEQLLNVANQQFRGRYLFAGSDTAVPFQNLGEFIKFLGNDTHLQTFANSDLLFNTNATGDEVFGAISAEVRGTADLNPILAENTRLSDLRGGAGISKGSIVVSDGATSKTIDISNATTLGDVAQLIEQNPPTNRKITARIAATGLVIDIDDALGGNLTIREVGGGKTAAELGILNSVGTGTAPIVGSDLDPRLRLTTRLSDILGVRATAVVSSAGSNNDIVLEAKQRGAQFNGFTLQFVDDELLRASPGLSAGSETVSYSSTAVAARAAVTFSGANNNLILTANTPGVALNNVQINIVSAGAVGNAATVNYNPTTKVLQIGVDSTGLTQVQTVINELALEGTFTAAYDASVPSDGGFLATATINAADIGVVQGNTGNSGGAANTIFVNIQNTITTAGDVVAAIQADTVVSALFDASLDSKDVTAGTTGVGAVVVNATGVTSGGSGVEFDQGSGLRIVNGGETHTISFQDAETIEDLLNILNSSTAHVTASINATGTGIDIRSRLSGSDFSIGENGGATATELGVRSFTADTLLSSLNHDRGVHTNTNGGADFIIRRNDGTDLVLDISTAQTIGDVLELINNHLDNQDPATRVLARLAPTGNGIEIVDDNPQGTGELTLFRDFFSEAAWDLGLIPRGLDQIRASDGPSPAPATAAIGFDPPNELNSAILLTAAAPGTDLNGVTVEFVQNLAVGDVALVAFDPLTKTLTVDVDPAATTASTVVAAITGEGTFTAALDLASDPTNDGSGLTADLGVLATTAGGTSNPSSIAASADVSFPPPNDVNTALIFQAQNPGTEFNGVTIEFQDTLVGNLATAVYDSLNKRLLVSIDAALTTANTIRTAVITEGTFFVDLDTSIDATNDGSGIVGAVGVVGTTAGGTPEVLAGSDVNPLETKGVFNSLLRLNRSLNDFDLIQIERAVALLDDDFDRVTFARGGLGALQQGLDSIQFRLEDEEIELKSALSKEIDVDLTEAISNLAAQQASLEASLRMIGQTFQLSLLDFL